LAKTAGIVFHPVSCAHHAFYACGSGFCTFNFLAGAALKAKGRRAIVDLDAHQGNGTFDLVAGNAKIGLLDISHASWDVKSSAARQPYTVARDAEEYFEQLARATALLETFRPELV
jgi:acetoin utilization deacetylase AcuC-like enzyme